jgi:hypothetical protein
MDQFTTDHGIVFTFLMECCITISASIAMPLKNNAENRGSNSAKS